MTFRWQRLHEGTANRVRFWTENIFFAIRAPKPAEVAIARLALPDGTRTLDSVNVIMCVWRRIERLPATIADLSRQVGVYPRLHIWNNNWDARQMVEDSVRMAAFPVSIIHCRPNIGGYGRFFLARELCVRGGDHDAPILFIDDDQTLASSALSTLLSEYQPDRMRSIWAFRFRSDRNYWERERVKPGEFAHYCGTGGLVAPQWVFRHPEVFSCPRIYWFVEDLWLSFVASTKLGISLSASAAQIGFVEDQFNQLDKLAYRKSRMLHYLTQHRGWDLS